MEDLRRLFSGFFGLVKLVRWALVTMFLLEPLRQAAASIGHTTHLLKYGVLLSNLQTNWKQSSDVLSDISLHILSDISSDISFDILSDIFLVYFLTFFWQIVWNSFWHIFWHSFWHIVRPAFWHIFWHFFSNKNPNPTSTASQKKPLCKLCIYLTPRSKSNIHDKFVPVHRTAQPKGS